MTIFVGRIVLSRFGSNTWILGASEGASEVAVVDPGGDPAPLLEQLEQDGTKVGGILVTHTDLDHVEGLAALVEATGADVWAPAGEADLLREGFARGRYAPVGAHEPEHEVDDGDTVEVAGMSFEVAGVPGHSRGTSPSVPTESSSPATCSSRGRSAASTSKEATGRRCSPRSSG